MSKNAQKIKTYKGWMESDASSLEQYLIPGDIVDEEMYNHFLNILPPLVWDGYYLQVREACDYIDGGNTYTTFTYKDGNYIYLGECHRNQSTHLSRVA